jgi:DNA-binding response OmpR family regulator
MVMEHVLLNAGYEVDTTGTMASGLELLDSRSYDLVITDGKLPDGTGMDIADQARKAGVEALVVTGYAFTLPGATGDRYEILLKPVRPAELIAAVEWALAHPR